MLKLIEREKIILKKVREMCSKTSQPGISIIVPTSKIKYIDNIFTNYKRFSYVNKELIIILNNNNMDMEEYIIRAEKFKDARVYQLDEKYTLGECLNYGIEQSRYDYVSKMDDDDYYGDNYLTDIMNAFKYTEAQVVGKAARFVYYEESKILTMDNTYYQNKYVSWLAGGTITAKKEIFNKVKFRNINCGEDNWFIKDCNSIGMNVYAADKYNYVYMRHENLDDHTYKINSEDLISGSSVVIKTADFIPIITA